MSGINSAAGGASIIGSEIAYQVPGPGGSGNYNVKHHNVDGPSQGNSLNKQMMSGQSPNHVATGATGNSTNSNVQRKNNRKSFQQKASGSQGKDSMNNVQSQKVLNKRIK